MAYDFNHLQNFLGQTRDGVKITGAVSNTSTGTTTNNSLSQSQTSNYAGLPDWMRPTAQGAVGEVRDLYAAGRNAWGPQQQAITDYYGNHLANNVAGAVNNVYGVGNQALGGGMYDQPAGVTGGGARALQGQLDPTASMQQMLSGTPNNPYLQSMHRANIDTSLRGYGDAMQDMANTLMPAIRGGAVAAGQYGGSRQGIAEGLALQQAARNARDLGIAGMGAGNQLYGGAFENAQQRMYGTANALNQQAQQMAEGNAARQLAGNAQDLQARQFGLQALTAGQQMGDAGAQAALNNSLAPTNYAWQQAGLASGMLNPLMNATREQYGNSASSSTSSGSSNQQSENNQLQGQLPQQIYKNNAATAAGLLTAGAPLIGPAANAISSLFNSGIPDYGLGEIGSGTSGIFDGSFAPNPAIGEGQFEIGQGFGQLGSGTAGLFGNGLYSLGF